MVSPRHQHIANDNAARSVGMQDFSKENRTRMSGPALRTFARLADVWSLSERDRLAIMGAPGRSTYHNWLAKARARQDLCLPLDTLLRLSALLGIYKALKLIFVREGEDVAWLKSPNSGACFGGQTPLSLITSGTQDGLLLVRRYLDAWRGGQGAAPIEGADFEQEPIEDDDLVFT